MIEEEGNNSGSVKAPKLVTQLVTTQKILKYVVGKHTAPITAETGAHGGSMVLAIRETPPDCVTRGIAHRGQTMPARLSLWTHLRLHGRPALGPLGGTTSDAAIATSMISRSFGGRFNTAFGRRIMTVVNFRRSPWRSRTSPMTCDGEMIRYPGK
jgi:hypothetical protein